VDGGPSVLYDAVALIPSRNGAELLAKEPAARDFVADAFAHNKFVAYADEAIPLLEKAIGQENLDAGFIHVGDSSDWGKFIASCRKFRFWERTFGRPERPGKHSGQR
jgi:catalase